MKKYTIYFLLLIPVLLIYIDVYNHEFVTFDDGVLIQYNRLVTEPSVNLWEVASKNINSPHFKPLVFLSWRLEWALVGNNPGVFIINNVLLHLLNTLLIFFIGLKIFKHLQFNSYKTKWASYTVALFFGILPIHVESVAWATERKDVLFTFFFLCSWLMYIKYITQKHYKLLLFSALFYLLSLLSKSAGITLFAVLFLTDWLYKRKFDKKFFTDKIPHAIVMFVGLALYGLLFNFSEHASGLTAGVTATAVQELPPSLINLPAIFVRIIIASVRFLLWFLHSLIPYKYSAIYPRMDILMWFGNWIYTLPFIAILLVSTPLLYIKKTPILLWGILFFCVTIVPALAISDLGTGIFLSDRYTYVPSIGLLFILVYALFGFDFKKTKLPLYCLAGIALWWGIAAFKQVKTWENSATLNTAILNVYPKSFVAYNNKGKYYREQNNYKLAIYNYTKSIECNPYYSKAYSNRGKAYFDLKKNDLALRDLNQSIKFNPTYATAYSNRGAVYGSMGKYNLALIDLKQSVELLKVINEDKLTAYANLALAYFYTKDYEKAAETFEYCGTMAPQDPSYFNEASSCFIKIGKLDQAIEAAKKSIQINPSFSHPYGNLSQAYYLKQNFKQAYDYILKAQKLGYDVNPKYLEDLSKRVQ